MPYFTGVNENRELVDGTVRLHEVATFIAKCKADGWVRVGVSETNIIASFNEQGEWIHPDLRRER